jgi:hypothetical protein
MPHSSVKLIPGVDQNRTTALNEAAISTSNLIRFVPDRQGIALVQKLGGWTKFFGSKISSIVRNLWAWEDTNSQSYLAVGAEQSLSYILNGSQKDITPRVRTDNVTVSANTVTGSNIVTFNETGSNLTNYDFVFFDTQICVGGLYINGLYQIYNPTNDANSFQIYAVDIFGNPVYATSTVTAGGVVPQFTVSVASAVVTVTAPNHGYSVGSTFPVLVSTTISGVTLYGNYLVNSVTTNTFTISANNTPTATTTAYMNGGQARYSFYIGTPPGLIGQGYGIGGYGIGGYGTGIQTSPPTGTISTQDWTLDNWGQILMACPLNGPVYQWSPIGGTINASIVPNCPVANSGMLVAMPQRQVVAWGSTFNGLQDPLLIRWSDVNDFTSWIGSVTNQAGSYRLPKGSKIVGAIQAPQQTLVWTDLSIWSMQYVGQPFVYQFNELGTGCGLIGRKAATSLNGVVYWMSQSQFFVMSGSGPQPLACPIWDVIFQDLDTNNLDKIRVAANSRFGEISWFYPTTGNSGEINAYIKYNTVLNQWDYGTMARSAWINQSVLGPPIGADPNTRYIYQHETSPDADGQPLNASFSTGFFALQEADVKTFIDQVWPDMRWGYYGGTADGQTIYQTPTAQIEITFYVADYPGQTPLVYGPYTVTQNSTYITPRFRARLMSIGISSNDVGSFWRLGDIRYRFQPDGKF